MRFTLADIARATSGTTNSPDVWISGVSTDSRTAGEGDLFVAIRGENFDGHAFIGQALSSGVAAVVSEHQVDGPHVLVENTLTALGDIARLHRERLSARVVAVTGSSGKTSTKDLLAQVLTTFGDTIAPPGSFNNEIGLPNTVLSATRDTQYLVLEMGMRGLGHIRYLCNIARPDVAILLNVGSAHMELLGSRAGIAQAKAEILEGLTPDGVAVLYADDSLIAGMRDRTRARVLTFGESPSADVRVSDVVLDSMARASFVVTFQGNTSNVRLQLAGEHQVLNSAAVIAACVGMGLDFEKVCAALSSATNASKWRMEVTELPRDITLINDAYNANPESMRAGLKALKAMSEGRRSWAVLGEMRELGDDRVAAHDEIGRLCVRLDINRLVAIGDAGKIIQMGAAQEGSFGNEAAHVATAEEAIEMLKREVRPGDVIFIKASRGVALERVAIALIDHFSRENSRP
ncbi:MAG: hypothetical protein RL441_526 [Actinomycetota bacterium]